MANEIHPEVNSIIIAGIILRNDNNINIGREKTHNHIIIVINIIFFISIYIEQCSVNRIVLYFFLILYMRSIFSSIVSHVLTVQNYY